MGNYCWQAACKNEPDSTEAKRAVELLYEAALISSGYTVSTVEYILDFDGLD